MKKLITVALSLIFMVGLSCVAIAGNLEPSGSPTAGSGMYTLQNLYDYLTSGTALTVQTSFQEPTSGPTVGTMKTTKEIGDAIKDKFNLCVAIADNVEQGVTFFCTQPGSWGVQTGTLSALPRPTATPTPTQTPTVTPTATQTPTITPIPWDSTACTAKGGAWLGLGSEVSGSGCWFNAGTSGVSCTAQCTAVNSMLECDPRDWDDDTSCTVARALKGWGSCARECSIIAGLSFSPSWDNRGPYDSCYPRGTGTHQSCDSSYGDTFTRLCVCRPIAQ